MSAPRPLSLADSSSRHSNNFNLCRLIFAMLVIFSHVPEALDGNREREFLTRIFHTVSLGEMAVDGFFVLSGYLIVQSWLSAPQIWTYLKKRLLRIFPGFVLASLICALVVGPLAAGPEYFSAFNSKQFAASVLWLSAPRIPAVFEGTKYAVVNGAMWTVHFEFTCYLAVLGFGALGLLRDRRIWLLATILIFILNILRSTGYHPAVLMFHDPLGHPMIRLSMPFFAGACFYLYRDRIIYTRKILLISISGLIAAMFSDMSAELALASAGAYALFYFAKTPIPVLMGFNRLPDISYGVYLYGWPLMKLIHWYFRDISVPALIGATVLASLAFGSASWHLIEKPFLKLKEKKISNPLKRSREA